MPVRLSAGKKKSIQSLLIFLAGAAFALVLFVFGWIDTWEAKTWDWRASILAKPGPATNNIRVILLDQNSLDWVKNKNGISWPWPRELYGAITSYCRRSGAKALAFDVLFSEPSKYGVDDDTSFGEAISDFGRFAASVFLGRTVGSELKWPDNLPPPNFKVIGLKEWLARTGSESIILPRASLPIPEVSQNAAVLCNVHAAPDRDGIFRRVKLLGVFDGRILPYLGLGTYLAANPHTLMRFEPDRVIVGPHSVPIDKHGDVILRYRGLSGTHKAYSAAAVLQSEIRILMGQKPTIRNRNAFKDKYVLFGFSAPGLYDLRPTPVSGMYPGVEIHATMLDNLISNDFIRQFPLWLTIILVIILALACSVLATFLSHPSESVVIGVVFIAIPILLSIWMYTRGFWLPLVTLEIAVTATFILALMTNYALEGRQRRFIKSAFRQYLSPDVIEQIIQNPAKLKLGGERKNLSIFFSDIEGFTLMSENLGAEDLTMLLNDYLSAMTDIIQEQDGTVDKYEGDAIVAFWNAPVEVPEHAVKAVRTALFCQTKLDEMRSAFRERIGWDMFMRIGINTGLAVAGNMGSRTRFDYTVLGDAVNLASRLEGVNKEFGTYTIISRSTRELLNQEFAARKIGRVLVVGRHEPVTLYEPMFPQEFVRKKELFEIFDRGLNLFYKGRFDQAMEIFAEIQDHDAAAQAYFNKCQTLVDSPPEDWEGVWVVTEK
ncbi:MAG: adenylate/guanylate cyclase domain-containing protein [Deltaproteobacteria bacterium]|nr:adenylate/guanylate cyclase domain-containing protein [Deltaproteobacteria bacterium]MBW2051496.1 adenylate/guanylate cyclase domain-containing protein [Deltaproteobacteria bacterium]MBW2140356.1 adenylate/guanylate cyclase domain-containing protein [Deltaproteobacteria bacterium]MBW2323727.1 adenylate/guanylate cyclase domain-containing protein [Deltaproteobacteria bacterium]